MISKTIFLTGITIFGLGSLILSNLSHPEYITQLPIAPHQAVLSTRSQSPTTHLQSKSYPTTSDVKLPPQSPSPIAVSYSTSPVSSLSPVTSSINPPVRPVRQTAASSAISALPYTSALSTSSGTVSSTSVPWWLATIHNPTTTTTGIGTLIAIIDTGFALDHSGLAGRFWINQGEVGPTTLEGAIPNCTSRGLTLDKSCNNLDNDGNGYFSDWHGYDFANNDNNPQTGTTNPTGGAVEHGTFVAGLIASSLTASSGGVDSKARIMTLEALDDTGSGSTTSVGDAVVYAADNGAKIINLSLGSSGDDPYLHEAIDYAIAKGAIVVAAAGNDGCNCMLFPANYPEVIGVGASTMTDIKANFSSFGTNIDLVAPGQDLCSTSWASSNTTSFYQCGGAGTSFATPIVVGALSRLLEAGIPSSIADQYLDIAADKVTDMTGAWRTLSYGTGRLDVSRAISAFSGPHVVTTADALIRNSCNGTASCSVNIINIAGNTVTTSSKQPTGQAAAVYWSTPSATSTPTVWLEYDFNTASSNFYTFT